MPFMHRRASCCWSWLTTTMDPVTGHCSPYMITSEFWLCTLTLNFNHFFYKHERGSEYVHKLITVCLIRKPQQRKSCFSHHFRGKFQKGGQVLHLWETNKAMTFIPEQSTSRRSQRKSFLELNWAQFSQILAGPAATNPSQMAVRTTLAFPEEDVYCPSTAKASRDSLM